MLASPVLWLSLALCVISLAHMGPDGWHGLERLLDLALRAIGRHPNQRIPYV
jgi:hypothetical protein